MEKDFFLKVYEIVAEIPFGKVTTYGHIAAAIGMKSSARTVGWALNSSKENTNLPFHRVVNRNGELTGKYHFATPGLMKELLVSEGVNFIDDHVDMMNHLWIPPME